MNGLVVVVDASLAVKWLVSEVHSEKAYALARSWAQAGMQPVAPYLMPVEVANALHRRVARKEVSATAAVRLLDGLLASGIELREPGSIHIRAIELATQLRQDAAYDAHYLALAETLNCDLWTADERFYRAVTVFSRRVKWLGAFRSINEPS
ncbi:MAG: type II toxin-antitoxin system VapC family toxin [Chloroflexi bacterium]|nr:type II toxin-antitoxin system VapC family toxin [Chloroflexota bacterium]